MADSLEIDPQLTLAAGHPVPYVEHFANGRDYLAQIGILSRLYGYVRGREPGLKGALSVVKKGMEPHG